MEDVKIIQTSSTEEKKSSFNENEEQLESYNYLNLEDDKVPAEPTKIFKDKDESATKFEDSEIKTIADDEKGKIIKIVHQISLGSNNEDNNANDITSEIISQEIFYPVIW